MYTYIYVGAEKPLAREQASFTPAEVTALSCVMHEPMEKLPSISTVSAICSPRQGPPPQAQSLGLPPCGQTQCKGESGCGEVCMCYKWV